MEVYADHAATTKCCAKAKDEMMKCMSEFYGNPSALHTVGRNAKEQLENYRKMIAECFNAEPEEIFFTSGGSESDTQAILSAAYAGKTRGCKHIITTEFEHHAVLHTFEKLKGEGFDVTLVPVNSSGIVKILDIAEAIRPDTCLVSVMRVNNEIGTLQPIKAIGELCRNNHIYFHTDAVQAAGKVDIDVKRDCIDYLSLSAHKFYGPRGIGVLYRKKNCPLINLVYGGEQENGFRPGTENLPAISGMAIALKLYDDNRKLFNGYVYDLTNYFMTELNNRIPSVKFNGCMNNLSSGVISVTFDGVNGENLMMLLDSRGIYVSTESACTSSSGEPSHVLKAIGLSDEEAGNTLRFSFGLDNTIGEIDYLLSQVTISYNMLKDLSK